MKKLRHLLALTVLILAVTARGALTDGMVSYWPLNTTNLITPDLSFTNDLTIVTNVQLVPGQFGNAMNFTGATNAYLLNVHPPDNGPTGLPIWRAGSYTVSFWVKGAAQTAKYLYTEASTTNNNPIFILQTGNAAASNNKLDVILRNTLGQVYINHATNTIPVFDNTWHHVAWVDDRGNVSVYIDGVLDPGSANFKYVYFHGDLVLNTTAVAALVRAAVQPNGNNFIGQIDEVATWERTLSQAEVNSSAHHWSSYSHLLSASFNSQGACECHEECRR